MHGNSQNPIITGDCANSVQRHPLHTVRNAPTVHLTTAPQPCAQLLTNAPQTRARGDMRVTERYGCPNATQPSQNNIAALSESLRRSMGWNALFWNGLLTFKSKTPSLSASVRRGSRCSVSQKGTSGFAARQTQGVRNRALFARFFFSQHSSCDYGFGRMGPRKRATPCGGTANSVRPAHQICSSVCRFTKNHKETCHV